MNNLEKLEQARHHYIQSQAETMEMYGLPHSMGVLYGNMMFRDEPMTLNEMCEQTGMSKSSMSKGVRELAKLQLVRKAFAKGSRKDLYEAEKDMYHSFIEFFTQIWLRAVELNQRGIQSAEKQINQLLADASLEPEVREMAENDIEKLQNAKLYYAWLRNLANGFLNGDTCIPIPEHHSD